VEYEKGNADWQRQIDEKIDRAISGDRRRREEKKFVLEKREEQEIERDADRQPEASIAERQCQEQIGAEDGAGEKRQQLRLAVAVKEDTGNDQNLHLKRPQGRQIVKAEDDRSKNAELPRRKAHRAFLVADGVYQYFGDRD
jgi:hypothetical protein